MRPTVLLILLVSAVAGAGTMCVELAAVRLLAPWFGASLPVWTNVIGVILLALAVGYLVGSRLAARARPLLWMGLGLLLAALFTAWLPFLARPVCDLFLPERIQLQDAAAFVTWGSLAASLVLFFLPAACLGLVGPLAVEAIQVRTGAHAGTVGGQVLACSTLGSLVGTFGTSLFAIPVLGVTWTFAGACAALGVAGLTALLLACAVDPDLRRAASGGAAAVLVVGAAAATLAPVEPPALRDGLVLLDSAESAYQDVRVVEDRTGEQPLRYLQVNEGFDSFQSVWQPEPGLLPEGFYYNDFALPAHWTRDHEGPWRVLVLGLGGGSAVRVLEGALPAGVVLEATGVELDRVVVELAREHMDLETDAPGRTVLAGLDARLALRAVEGPFDQIVLDVYANQVEIPPHLCTVEFFQEVEGLLEPGGWLTANIGAFGLDDPLVRVVRDALEQAFSAPSVAVQVPGSRNVTLIARELTEPPWPGDGAWAAVPDDVYRQLLAKREPPSSRSFGWWEAPPTSDRPRLITDRGWNPIERMQLDSIKKGRSRLHEVDRRLRDLLDDGGEGERAEPDLAFDALAAGRYGDALDLAGRVEAPDERARAIAEVLYLTRDFGGCLAAVDRGIEAGSSDLLLLWRGASAALALTDPGLAEAHLERLRAALPDAGLSDDERTGWDEGVAGLAEQAATQRADLAERDRKARRAELAVLVLGSAALGLLGWTGFRSLA